MHPPLTLTHLALISEIWLNAPQVVFTQLGKVLKTFEVLYNANKIETITMLFTCLDHLTSIRDQSAPVLLRHLVGYYSKPHTYHSLDHLNGLFSDILTRTRVPIGIFLGSYLETFEERQTSMSDLSLMWAI